MENELSQAFSLLGIGMITVFVVLSLVYIVGNFLIRLVNRISPVSETRSAETSLSKSKIAAITAAVEVISGGKAHITKIEKE